jgi:HEAT repeat protein
MNRPFRSRWLWLALLVVILPVCGLLYLRNSVTNVMHPALDTLSNVNLADRWSHPEMLRIRKLGPKAIPPLRQVLREKDSMTTRFLLWTKAKWPGSTRYFHSFPDPQKMSERRWTACQVLQTLGPAGKSAVPEIIKVLQSKDQGDSNAGGMALWAVGIDAAVCDKLDAALENGTPQWGTVQILSALGSVKPPSVRTLNALTAALADTNTVVQHQAAQTLSQLGVATPAALSALKKLQSTSTDDMVVMDSSIALWEFEKDAGSLPAVFRVLQGRLDKPMVPLPGGGSGGQGVTAEDQCFMAAGELFYKMKLAEPDKSKALGMLDSWCGKSGRIFVRMLLLPAMMELGFPREKCLAVCTTGLAQPEDYYRMQAVGLLAQVGGKFPESEVDLDALLHDREVGVRVYAAALYWQNKKQAKVVVPVLVEALNRTKHQSYYYDNQILPTALRVLGDIGPEARDAASDLDTVTRDPNPAIAKLATDALTKIRR